MPTKGICLIAVTLAVFLAGCGDPVIDGTSDVAFRSSVEAMKQLLTEKDGRELDKALQGFEFLISENALTVLADSSRIKERMRSRLRGLSTQEVLDLWNERRDRAIKDLEDKKANTESALENLKNVIIEKSRFRKQRNGMRVVDLTVKNDTEQTISHMYFHGVLTSRGRQNPWVEDDFHYLMTEELEPGKTVSWSFALLAIAWKRAPGNWKNLKLDVTVTRIDGEDDEPIYDAYTNRFSKRDQVRFDTLKSYQGEHVADNNAS